MTEINEFAERVSNIYIQHPKVKTIWGIMDSIRAHKRMMGRTNSPRNMFIKGPSGVGKTQMVKKYAELNKGYIYTYEDGTEIDVKPVVCMELPSPFTIQELYQSIVAELGAPHLHGRPTIGEVKRQAFTLIKNQKVELLILDEIDYMLESRHVTSIEAMESIKHIANTAQVSLALVGSPSSEEILKGKFQYFRRYPTSKLDRFVEYNKDFCELLNDIEDQIISPVRIGLGDEETGIPQVLYHMSKGLVGILTPIIQEAYILLGIFDFHFRNLQDMRITVDILEKAYANIVGDIDEDKFQKMLKDN